MEYSIPTDHPLGSIDVEYDRLDYFLRRNMPAALRSTCASFRESSATWSEHLLIADLFEGLCALAEGRREEGIPKLRSALTGPPYIHIRAASAMAAQEVADGNLSGAAEILHPLIAQDPPSPHFHTALGMYLAVSGDAAAGWASYVRALHINPNHLPAVWLLSSLASSPERQREFKGLLLRFLENEPDNGNVRIHLASCLFLLGEVEAAGAEIQRIVAFLEVAPVSDESLAILRKLTSTMASATGGGRDE